MTGHPVVHQSAAPINTISPPKETAVVAPPPVDRYSALKDLDALFTTSTTTTTSVSAEPQASTTQPAATNWAPTWNPAPPPNATLITSTESAFASNLQSAPSAWGTAFSQPQSSAASTASIASSNPFLGKQNSLNSKILFLKFYLHRTIYHFNSNSFSSFPG